MTSNWPSYEVVQPFGALPLGAISSVTAWGMAKAVAARARRASDVLILESNYVMKAIQKTLLSRWTKDVFVSIWLLVMMSLFNREKQPA